MVRASLLLGVLLLVACGAGSDWGPFRTPELSKLNDAQLNDYVAKLAADEQNFSAERRDLLLSTRVDVTIGADSRSNFSRIQRFFQGDAARGWSLFATVARLQEEQHSVVGKWRVDTSAPPAGEVAWNKLDPKTPGEQPVVVVPLVCDDGIARFSAATKEEPSTMMYLIETDDIGALMAVLDRDK